MIPDRALVLEPGQSVRTGYVPVFDCVLACRERMSVGDVDRAFQKVLQLGDKSMWPCVNGYWREDGRFVILDERHEWIASIMQGREHILVAWIDSTRILHV